MDQPQCGGGGIRQVGPVIGAGLGGIAAAIGLAAMGCAVTEVEMADGPGGKARGVATSARPTNTGPTVLTSPHLAEELFALCGRRAGDMVDITALPELARHWWPDGSRLDLAPDADANAAAGRGVLW